MTDTPTPNTPLSQDDWQAGDWLRIVCAWPGFSEGQAVRAKTTGSFNLTVEGDVQGDLNPTRFQWLARPADPNDPEGWVKHDGGPNPARGLKVESKALAGELRRPMRSENVQWTSTTFWRPHVPARGGEGETLGPAAAFWANVKKPEAKGEVEAAVENLKDEVSVWSPEENAGHDVGVDHYVTDFLTVGDIRTLLSALTASKEREARAVEALERIRDLGSDGEHSGDRHARCRDIARQSLSTLKEPEQ